MLREQREREREREHQLMCCNKSQVFSKRKVTIVHARNVRTHVIREHENE